MCNDKTNDEREACQIVKCININYRLNITYIAYRHTNREVLEYV